MTDEKSTEIISKTLKELRIHLHLTQEQISKDLNIARQTYSYFETGNRTPSLEMARRLAEYHNITIDQLVIREFIPHTVTLLILCQSHTRRLCVPITNCLLALKKNLKVISNI